MAKYEFEILGLKSLREDLCLAQCALNMYPVGDQKGRVKRIGAIIDQIDTYRPLGSNGKHGNLHTDYCDCEDKDGNS